MINQTDKLVVVSYYSKKCLICDRAQPILEDVGTQFYRDAEFAMIDVDKPQFKSLCLEQVKILDPSFNSKITCTVQDVTLDSLTLRPHASRNEDKIDLL